MVSHDFHYAVTHAGKILPWMRNCFLTAPQRIPAQRRLPQDDREGRPMIELLRQLLSYEFIVRALIVGTLVSSKCGAAGVSLVLKRYSMIGGWFIPCRIWSPFHRHGPEPIPPLQVSIPIVVLAAFCCCASAKQQNQGMPPLP